MASTRLEVHIRAPRSSVYRALLDAQAVSMWMVPDDMTSQVHTFEAWEGGTFRISLTYNAPTGVGKTSAHTDTFQGHFVHLIPDEEVVQVVEFETQAAAMAGRMAITYRLSDATGGGTRVTAVHDGLPPGVSAQDNELGWRMSLGRLAALLEHRV
jgi:uncharacterized protein YndB with AHSA1/START domain